MVSIFATLNLIASIPGHSILTSENNDRKVSELYIQEHYIHVGRGTEDVTAQIHTMTWFGDEKCM